MFIKNTNVYTDPRMNRLKLKAQTATSMVLILNLV